MLEGLGAATLSLDVGRETAVDREAMLNTVYREAWNLGLRRQIPQAPSDTDLHISRLSPTGSPYTTPLIEKQESAAWKLRP